MPEKVKEFKNPVYLIEFIYVSGARARYWLAEFNLKDSKATWKMPSNICQIMYLNIDNVESIHQLAIKELDDLDDPTDTRMSWER